MDQYDRQRYASVYRLLAEILGRERPADRHENHLSYSLGDLTARVFVGSPYLPPDELLESVAQILRGGELDKWTSMARRLQEHARHLEELPE